jgi:chemotaxis signal transduction protein
MNRAELPPHVREILKQRSEKYASEVNIDQDHAILDTVVVMGLCKQKIGVSIGKIKVIGKTPPIAHLPAMPPVIRGVILKNGELMAVVDISGWLGIDAAADTPLIAVVEGPSGRKLGLLIDEVIGFQEIAEEDLLESFLEKKNHGQHPVSGTTRDLVAIIDVDRLFNAKDVVALKAQCER